MNYVIKQLNKIKCKSEQVEIIYSQFQQYFVDNFQPINLNISLDYKSLFKLHEKEKKQSNIKNNNDNNYSNNSNINYLIQIFPLFPQNIDISLHPYIGILQTYLEEIYRNIISYTSKWICSSPRNYLSNDISYTEKCLSCIVYSLLNFSNSISFFKEMSYEIEISNYSKSQFLFNNVLIWNNRDKINIENLVYVYNMFFYFIIIAY